MLRQPNSSVLGGAAYATELGGRDRFKFFRCPVEPEGAITGNAGDQPPHNFTLSCPSMSLASNMFERDPNDRHAANSSSSSVQGFRQKRRSRPHHLPSLRRAGTPNVRGRRAAPQPLREAGVGTASRESHGGKRDAVAQTQFRENDAQTDPFTPDYYIPDGAEEPEILKLNGLTWKNGLPAGKEEVELIHRLRRRREAEATLPSGDDAASVEKRYTVLHELEEEEWKEREEHAAKLQERRLEKLQDVLTERELEREEHNMHRLQMVREQKLTALRGKLDKSQSKRMATARRTLDAKLSTARSGAAIPAAGTDLAVSRGKKADLVEMYSKYGKDAAPPVTDFASSGAPAHTNTGPETYDVRPVLLNESVGVELVDSSCGPQIEAVSEKKFAVIENEAIARLPTLYQRREAQRIMDALQFAHDKIHGGGEDKEATIRVLDLYRATPKLQRPDTPELELEGDADENLEEACILLQRLLRGRAVQNDFFEGKERCRGLIAELQAASNAKYAERSLIGANERVELAVKQEIMVQSVLDAAQGDIISDTLGYLFQELGRQQDIMLRESLRLEAVAVREAREAMETVRREEERVRREKEEVQYALYVRATDATIDCFLQEAYTSSVETTALAEAVGAELARQAVQPAPRAPDSEVDKENIVCDMLDGFVIPAVVDMIALRGAELDKKAPAAAVLQVMSAAVTGG